MLNPCRVNGSRVCSATGLDHLGRQDAGIMIILCCQWADVRLWEAARYCSGGVKAQSVVQDTVRAGREFPGLQGGQGSLVLRLLGIQVLLEATEELRRD